MQLSRTTTRYRKSIPVAFIFLIYLTTEGMSYLSLILLEKKWNIRYDPNVATLSEFQRTQLKKFVEAKRGERVVQDPDLGWGISVAAANRAGMRDDREYERFAPPGILRLAAYGDSFTYGADVALHETWGKQLAAIDSSFEVLNYGVGAYGLDQAYLRYLRVGTEYNPHIVLIGYMSENLARNVNVFRPFYMSGYRNVIFTKPRFKMEEGKLVLLKNPVATVEDHERLLQNDKEVLAKLGENDYHYQNRHNEGAFDVFPTVRFAKVFWTGIKQRTGNPILKRNGMYNVESEAYEVTVGILDSFCRAVLENGALPVIIVFPDIHDQRRTRKKQERRYAPLLEDLRGRQYYVIDAMDALEPYESRYSIAELTRNFGHYSPLGNRIIAEYIYARLSQWELTKVSAVGEAVEAFRRNLGLAFRQ
jgi:hypothetical protein